MEPIIGFAHQPKKAIVSISMVKPSNSAIKISMNKIKEYSRYLISFFENMNPCSFELNFMRNTCPIHLKNLIRPHTPIRREKACLSAFKCLSYLRLNIGVRLTQTLLGFVIYSKRLWDEGISNDPNDLCRKPSHIIKRLNIGGQ